MISTTTIAPAEIIAFVAADFNITVEQLMGRRRRRTWCHARFIAAYLIRVFDPGIGLVPLAKALGRKYHSGMVHALGRAAEMMNDPGVEARVERLQGLIAKRRANPDCCPFCKRDMNRKVTAQELTEKFFPKLAAEQKIQMMEALVERVFARETPTQGSN